MEENSKEENSKHEIRNKLQKIRNSKRFGIELFLCLFRYSNFDIRI
jgi:hypothetical protein